MNTKSQRDKILGLLVSARGAWVPLPEITALAADNFSDIYVQDDRAGANFGANGTWLTLYRASAITGGTTTISTTSSGAVRTLTILEVAGLAPSPVDVKNQAGNTFTGGSCNSAVTTTNANDLVLNFCIGVFT